VMHVVGVIIHGHPDRRYFFLAYPHLAGDSNLNLECIRMALVQFAKDTGFVLRPNLYIQIDNASDNKSRFVFGALATMVLNGLVNQVELVMLPVGHTACQRRQWADTAQGRGSRHHRCASCSG
jgi:hypothetical protein